MDTILDTPTKEQRDAAYKVYRRALKRGELKRGVVCDWCGQPSTDDKLLHGHHPDYARPLMVIWICQPCHSRHHSSYRIDRRVKNSFL